MERFNYKRPWDEDWFDIYDDDILGYLKTQASIAKSQA